MSILNRIKEAFCRHAFRARDPSLRDDDGMVSWPCCKCGRVFRSHAGYTIFSHGPLEGNWK